MSLARGRVQLPVVQCPPLWSFGLELERLTIHDWPGGAKRGEIVKRTTMSPNVPVDGKPLGRGILNPSRFSASQI